MRITSSQIKQSVPLPNRGQVVLAQTIEGLDPTRNIFLIDATNQVIWQVEPVLPSHGVTEYSSIRLDSENRLLAYSANGIEYHLDPENGRVLNKELIR